MKVSPGQSIPIDIPLAKNIFYPFLCSTSISAFSDLIVFFLYTVVTCILILDLHF
jgi:hypothetical protein